METTNTPGSDLLRAEHRRMETHLDSMLVALKHLNAEQVEGIRQDFVAIQELSTVHFEQEERIFYPQIRPKAPELLAHMDEEHAVVRETERCLLELLDEIPVSPEQRDLEELYRIGIEFHDAIQVHIIDEEDQLLKFADGLLSPGEQQRLAAQMFQIASP